MKYYAYAVVSKENPLIQRATLETEASARNFIKIYGDENHSIVRLTSSDDESLEKALGHLTTRHINLGKKHDLLVLENRGLTNRIEKLEKVLIEIIAETTNPYHSPWTKIDNITCIARETMGVKG
jgi:hypothetical protein